MPRWVTRLALWGPLIIAVLLVAGYVYLHDPFARDGTQLVAVPLSEADPAQDRVDNLLYRGGLDIPRMGQNIGGLSGLRWDAESGRLLAITDDARWVWITPEEAGGRLTGIAGVEIGPLLGINGQPLTGKVAGDSESLSRDNLGVWQVSFERDHRLLSYPNGFEAAAASVDLKPEIELGALEDNAGLEAVANGAAGQIICAERQVTQGPVAKRANCLLFRAADERRVPFAADPPDAIADLGGVPTDADTLSDGTFVILFRSWSPANGNRAAIVSYASDGTRRELATLHPPLSLDNFEGLAVREQGDQTFLYIISDDNFSASQRTLLMKFELLP